MNTLRKIQKNLPTNSDVRDMNAVESAIFHIPTALKTNLPHIASSFSAVSIRDIVALLSSAQLRLTEHDREKLRSLVQTLTARISNQIETVIPRKTNDIFSCPNKTIRKRGSKNKTRKQSN